MGDCREHTAGEGRDGIKTSRLLARLLTSDVLAEVWAPDEPTRARPAVGVGGGSRAGPAPGTKAGTEGRGAQLTSQVGVEHAHLLRRAPMGFARTVDCGHGDEQEQPRGFFRVFPDSWRSGRCKTFPMKGGPIMSGSRMKGALPADSWVRTCQDTARGVRSDRIRAGRETDQTQTPAERPRVGTDRRALVRRDLAVRPTGESVGGH